MQNTDDDGYTEGSGDYATKSDGTADFDSDIINSIVKDAPEGFDKVSDYLSTAKITSENVTENVFELKYNRKSISLTFELAGGATTTSLTDSKLTGLYGATVTIVDPTKTGYEFTAWNPALPTTFPATVTDGTTYTATYTATEYSITYELDGGTNDSENPEKYTIEIETITLADATKDGFVFEGWYSDVNKTTQVTSIEKGSTGEKTFYAKFTEITLAIKAGETEITDSYDWSASEAESSDTLSLTADTLDGATVAWSVKNSDNGDSELVEISDSGVLSFKTEKTRPSSEDADVTVKVTATATKDNGSKSVTVSIVIKATEAANGNNENGADNQDGGGESGSDTSV